MGNISHKFYSKTILFARLFYDYLYLCVYLCLMSQYLIYINLPKYLSQWITNRLGNPVVFPPGSPQNSIIRTYIRERLPGEAVDVLRPDDDRTAIAIPDSVAKPPEKYNFMGERGKLAVAETIKDLFKRSLWCDISPLEKSPCGLNKLLAAWCEMKGIDIDRIESVRQCYYRMRAEYAKCGINLKKVHEK